MASRVDKFAAIDERFRLRAVAGIAAPGVATPPPQPSAPVLKQRFVSCSSPRTPSLLSMMPRIWVRSPLPQPAPPPALTQRLASCFGENPRAWASIPFAICDLDCTVNSPLLSTLVVVWELSPVTPFAALLAGPVTPLRCRQLHLWRLLPRFQRHCRRLPRHLIVPQPGRASRP